MADPFQIEARHDGNGNYTLALTGELDLATAREFNHALKTACQDGADTITIDLAGLTFADSTGLRAVVQGHRFCLDHGSEYWLRRTMPQRLKRLLEITGLAPDTLPLVDEPPGDNPRA